MPPCAASFCFLKQHRVNAFCLCYKKYNKCLFCIKEPISIPQLLFIVDIDVPFSCFTQKGNARAETNELGLYQNQI